MSREPPPIERSPERDAALRALLPLVPERGWTRSALRAALVSLGQPPELAESLFPRGPAGLVEAWCDLTDREMAAAAAAEDLDSLRIPARIRALVGLRLPLLAPQKEAARRAAGLLALPWNLPAAGRVSARTADAIWVAAGDTSTDRSWYTRRATLAGIYTATMTFWLARDSMEDTMAFLDRRLAELAKLQKR